MSVKDYKGREIIVSINDGPDAEKKKRRRGMVPPIKPPNEFLPRRKKRDSQIYVRLFDLARDAAGVDIDFAFGAPPTLNLLDTGGGFIRYDNNPLSNNYAAALNSYLLALDMETAFEINSTDLYSQYGTDIAGFTAEYETGKGFPVPGGPLAQNGGNAFRRFSTLDSGHYKVTSTPSFAADPVDFDQDADALVFLAPTMPLWFGEGFTTAGTDKFDWLLNGFYRHFPRTYFLNNPDFESQFGNPPFRTNVFYTGVPPRPTYPSAIRSAWKAANVGDPNSRVFKVNHFISFFARWYISHTVPTPSTFPDLATAGVVNAPTSTPAAAAPFCQMIDQTVPAGLLVAAVKKGSDWFYIWNIAANVLFARGIYQIAV